MDAKKVQQPVVEVKRTRSTEIKGDAVLVVRWTKKKESDPEPTKCEWAISFTGVTPEEILEIAAAEMVIRVQSDYRKGKIGQKAVIKVREMLDRERAAFVATPESVLRQVGKLSAEQKKELLKQLGITK